MIDHYRFKYNNQIVLVKPNETDCSKYTVELDSHTWIVSGKELKDKDYIPVNSKAEQLLRSIV